MFVVVEMAGRLRTSTLQWAVGVFCGILGIMMLVTPHQFDAPSYSALRPNLVWCGTALVVAASSLFARAGFGLGQAVTAGTHLFTAVIFGLMGLGLWSAGGVTGLIAYGGLGLGLIATMLVRPREPDASHQGDAFALTIAATSILFGATFLAVPGQFRGPIYATVASLTPELGILFLAGGSALLYTQVRPARRIAVWASHLAVASAFLSFVALVVVPTRAWSGLAYYGGFGVVIALLPWLGPRLDRIDPFSLRTRLALTLVAIVTVPMVILAAAYGNQAEQAALSLVLTDHEARADFQSQDIADYVRQHLAAVSAVATRVNVLALSPDQQRATLRTLVATDVSAFSTYDSSGQPIARGDDRPLAPLASTQTDEIRRTGEPAVELVDSPTNPRSVLVLAAAVRGDGQQVRGFVAAEIESTKLLAQLTRFDPQGRTGSSVVLVDAGGKTIAASDAGATSSSMDRSRQPIVAELLATSGSGAMPYQGAGEEAKLAGFSRVPGVGWGVVVESPTSVALATKIDGQLHAFEFLLLIMIVAAAAGVVAADRVVIPIAELATAIDRFAGGDNATRLPISAFTEIARLASLLGQMRERLTARTLERERAAAELRESEERIRLVIDTALDAVVTMSDSGLVIGWNTQAESMFGWARHEALGASLSDLFIPPRERAAHENGVRQFLMTGEGSVLNRRIERTAIRRDGTDIEVELTVTAFQRNGSYCFNAFIRDLTERRKADEVRSRLAAIVESSEDAIIGKTLDGVITSWNRGAERLFGYAATETVGRSISFLYPADRQDEVPSILDQVRQGKPVLHYETVRRRKDGSLVDVSVTVSLVLDPTGRVTGASAIKRDITERKRAEEAFRFLADASRILASSLDFETTLRRVVSLAVPYFADWSTVDMVDDVGVMRRVAAAHSDPAKVELLYEMLRRYPIHHDEPRGAAIVMRTGQPSVQPELTEEDLRTVARDDRHLQMLRELGPRSHMIVPLMARGRQLGALSFTRGESRRGYSEAELPMFEDLGRRAAAAIDNAQLFREAQDSLAAARAAGEEIRALNASLETRVAERTTQLTVANEELQAFSYSVAHDLRAPLRGIDGLSQALYEDYFSQLDSTGHLYLTRIRKASQHMGQLIDDLLALARVSRREMQRDDVDLSALVRAIASELQEREPDRVVSFVITERITVWGDPNLLRAALQNLLENAWKFTSKHAEAQIEFGVDSRGGSNVYYVRDDGAGFDKSHVKRLFGAFQRLHHQSEFAGTGVGLATVQRIIHRHGGEIWAEGAIENGATFFFTLGG